MNVLFPVRGTIAGKKISIPFVPLLGSHGRSHGRADGAGFVVERSSSLRLRENGLRGNTSMAFQTQMGVTSSFNTDSPNYEYFIVRK